MLAFQGAEGRLTLAGLAVEPQAVETGASKFDLSLSLAEERDGSGGAAGISGALEYASDLFDAGSAVALADRFVRLLSGAVADPDRSIGSLEVLSEAERRQLLTDWNATGRALAGGTLVDRFASRLLRAPKRTRWCGTAGV